MRAERGRSSGEVVPWKEMERRVAERIAAQAARRSSGRSSIPPWKQNGSQSASQSVESSERAPDSGVRASDPALMAAKDANAANRPLTFTVYSVEELDARQRFSAPPPSAPPPPPSRWPDVWRSSKQLLRAWWAWYQTPKPRSRVMDVCGGPLAALRVDLAASLKQLPWRKIGVRAGIGVASFLTLMFVVLTAAELTDDLKPGAPRQLGTRPTATASAAAATEAPPPVIAPADVPVIELEEAVAAPASVHVETVMKKPIAAAKKPAATKKKSRKGADVFNP